MKPCFTKLCTAQRQVFCPSHQAILCYDCKDKFHNQCQVDEIVDPARITRNITHMHRVLETMTEDHQRLGIDIHIEGFEEFVQEFKSKIDHVKDKLEEPFKHDKFLEYKALLQEILGIRSELNQSKIYQEYCSFLVNFNSTFKLDTNQKQELGEEAIDTRVTLTSFDTQNVTKSYLDELEEDMELTKLYEKVMKSDLKSKKLDELKIDLNLTKDVELIEKVLASNTKVKNLKCLTIQNCDIGILTIRKLLDSCLLLDVEKLKLTCGNKDSLNLCKIQPILPSLTSVIESVKFKEVHLDAWKFDSDELSILLNSCYDVETVSVQHTYLENWQGMKLDETKRFDTCVLKLSPWIGKTFLRDTLDSILTGICDCNLKFSLNKVKISGVDETSLSTIKSIAKDLNLNHIEFC